VFVIPTEEEQDKQKQKKIKMGVKNTRRIIGVN